MFAKILWRYAALEREVQTLIAERCGSICSLCPQCCCRADICEEALDSAFLKKLHGQNRKSVAFSDRFGWLTEKGCGLALGRPPVCYEFFCEELIEVQPDKTHRYVLKLLGKLVGHAGKNAMGHTHLVNITDEQELENVSLLHFKERLNEARSALEHIRFFYHNGFFDEDAALQFQPVLSMPEEL